MVPLVTGVQGDEKLEDCHSPGILGIHVGIAQV